MKTVDLRIVKVLDSETFVINHGLDAEIKNGQRFLVYGLGEELFDPGSKQSLGQLELIRGTGKVVHVQEKMSTVKSDMKSSPLKTIRKRDNPLTGFHSLLSGLGDITEEEVLPPVTKPFEGLELGDRRRPI